MALSKAIGKVLTQCIADHQKYSKDLKKFDAAMTNLKINHGTAYSLDHLRAFLKDELLGAELPWHGPGGLRRRCRWPKGPDGKADPNA